MTDKNTEDRQAADEMLKRVERLQRQAGGGGLGEQPEARKTGTADKKPATTLEQANRALEEAQRAGRVFNEVAGVWDAVVTPIKTAWTFIKPTVEIAKHAAVKTGEALSFLAPVGRPLWNGYKALFNRVAYTKDDNGERTVLNKPRALGAVALSLLAAWGAVAHGGPFMANLGYDAVAMSTSWQNGVPVYLTGANPTDDTDDTFYVKGCEELPCTDSNSVYYRLRDNTILSVYRFTTTGKGFWPEDVGSAIPEETSFCKISTYGWRVRALGMYPHITSIESCAPISTMNGGPQNPAPLPAPSM